MKTFISSLLISIAVIVVSSLVTDIAYAATCTLSIPAGDGFVKAGPSVVPAAGNPDWGATFWADEGYFITLHHIARIRQAGTIKRVRLYTYSKTGLTHFSVTVWRENPDGTFNLVGESENIVSQLNADSFDTVDLAQPITGVREGDFYGYRMDNLITTTAAFNFSAVTPAGGGLSAMFADTTPSPTNFPWRSSTFQLPALLPVELYMDSPQVVFIGDSIMAGYPNHRTFIETTDITDLDSTIPYHFAGDAYTFQNMAISGQTTTQINARFADDVIALNPKLIVLEGGVNDIGAGHSEATFTANMTSMLDQAATAGIKVIVLKILPWSNGSTAQLQMRDTWNGVIDSLVASYPNATSVDASSYVGEFRAGGDAGNLWNIQPAYNVDGVHFNSAGHDQIAQAICDAVTTLPPDTPTIIAPTNGFQTEETTLVVHGTGSVAGATIRIYSGSTIIGSGSVSAGPEFTWSITTPELTVGTHNWTITQDDGFESEPVSLVIDVKTPPDTPTIISPTSGFQTDATTLVVHGTGSVAGATIRIYSGSTIIGSGSVSVGPEFTWSTTTPELTVGTHNWTITQDDGFESEPVSLSVVISAKTPAIVYPTEPTTNIRQGSGGGCRGTNCSGRLMEKYATYAAARFGSSFGYNETPKQTEPPAKESIGGPTSEQTMHEQPAMPRCQADSLSSRNGRLSATVDGRVTTFRDIPTTAWYTCPIAELISEGILSGYKDQQGLPLGLFKPTRQVSSAEAIKLAFRLSGKHPIAIQGRPKNPTAKNHWAIPFITHAEQVHLSTLTINTDINAPMTRSNVIQTIVELLDVETDPNDDVQKSPYTDVPSSHPHAEAIALAHQNGWIQGDTNSNGNPTNRFRPNSTITRAEAAAIAWRVLQE